jgi:hypothetical protein
MTCFIRRRCRCTKTKNQKKPQNSNRRKPKPAPKQTISKTQATSLINGPKSDGKTTGHHEKEMTKLLEIKEIQTEAFMLPAITAAEEAEEEKAGV